MLQKLRNKILKTQMVTMIMNGRCESLMMRRNMSPTRIPSFTSWCSFLLCLWWCSLPTGISKYILYHDNASHYIIQSTDCWVWSVSEYLGICVGQNEFSLVVFCNLSLDPPCSTHPKKQGFWLRRRVINYNITANCFLASTVNIVVFYLKYLASYNIVLRNLLSLNDVCQLVFW